MSMYKCVCACHTGRYHHQRHPNTQSRLALCSRPRVIAPADTLFFAARPQHSVCVCVHWPQNHNFSLLHTDFASFWNLFLRPTVFQNAHRIHFNLSHHHPADDQVDADAVSLSETSFLVATRMRLSNKEERVNRVPDYLVLTRCFPNWTFHSFRPRMATFENWLLFYGNHRLWFLGWFGVCVCEGSSLPTTNLTFFFNGQRVWRKSFKFVSAFFVLLFFFRCGTQDFDFTSRLNFWAH